MAAAQVALPTATAVAAPACCAAVCAAAALPPAASTAAAAFWALAATSGLLWPNSAEGRPPRRRFAWQQVRGAAQVEAGSAVEPFRTPAQRQAEVAALFRCAVGDA